MLSKPTSIAIFGFRNFFQKIDPIPNNIALVNCFSKKRVNIEQFRQQLWARHLIDPTYANFSASFSKLSEPHSYQSFQTKIVSVHYRAS